MQMTEEGLALIRQFEGFRAGAYRDPVGVLTIGFGHTNMAGAPLVEAGQVISVQLAEAILRRDVETFAAVVARLLRVPLSPLQFSALVSFCYNVGSANFRKSGVLEAVNRGDFAAVPRRLGLWTKAGGRVLPGLIKRRAAEAALFMGGADTGAGKAEQPVTGKEPHKSTTILVALATAILAALQTVLGDAAPILAVLIFTAIVAGTVWIIAERVKKSKRDGL
jgi:lysozyme